MPRSSQFERRTICGLAVAALLAFPWQARPQNLCSRRRRHRRGPPRVARRHEARVGLLAPGDRVGDRRGGVCPHPRRDPAPWLPHLGRGPGVRPGSVRVPGQSLPHGRVPRHRTSGRLRHSGVAARERPPHERQRRHGRNAHRARPACPHRRRETNRGGKGPRRQPLRTLGLPRTHQRGDGGLRRPREPGSRRFRGVAGRPSQRRGKRCLDHSRGRSSAGGGRRGVRDPRQRLPASGALPARFHPPDTQLRERPWGQRIRRREHLRTARVEGGLSLRRLRSFLGRARHGSLRHPRRRPPHPPLDAQLLPRISGTRET